jgi:hypothetical protein
MLAREPDLNTEFVNVAGIRAVGFQINSKTKYFAIGAHAENARLKA